LRSSETYSTIADQEERRAFRENYQRRVRERGQG
jgi:hypothetical protein